MNDLVSRARLLEEYDKSHRWFRGGKNRELIENAPAVNAWVSVDDRLPEENEFVIVVLYSPYQYNQPIVTVDCMLGGNWHINSARGEAITHWMPLPQPPKEV